MPSLSKRSLEQLNTCDPRLVAILNEVIKHYDFTVICGHRTQEDQDQVFREGTSKLRWPNSKHNSLPSKAVDIAPYPLDWDDEVRFARLMGHVERVANEQGIRLRFGLDFDGDGRSNDERFLDYPHVELVD